MVREVEVDKDSESRWMNEIKEATGLSMQSLAGLTEGRAEWRTDVMGWSQDGCS